LLHFARAFAFLISVPILAIAQDTYLQGQQALNRHRWQEALELFSRPAQPSVDDEGLAYWKAFTLAHLGRKDEAGAMLREVRAAKPAGRWVKEVDALEAAIKKGLPAEAETSEVMTPIYNLARRDPERATADLEAILKAPHVPEIKSYAVTSIGSMRSEGAKALLERLARGSMSPDVQRYALSMMGRQDPKLLLDIYWATTETRIRTFIEVCFNNLRDTERLLEIARNEKTENLRSNAIRMLVDSGGEVEAAALIAKETSAELKDEGEAWLASLKRTTETALADLKSPDTAVRQRAVNSLYRGGDAEIDRALARAYAVEKEPQVKSGIGYTLVRRHSFDTVAALARSEQDMDLKRSLARQLMDTDDGLRVLLK
jgi:hypothetical protein